MSITIPTNGPKVTSMLWGTLDEFLVTGHDNGDIVQWDLKTHHKIKMATHHEKNITDMQLSADGKGQSRNDVTFLAQLVFQKLYLQIPILQTFLVNISNYYQLKLGVLHFF